MRIPRLLGAALLLAATPVLARPASAQFTVSRSQAVQGERTDAQRAVFDAVNADLNALFDAQRAYFREHGRYAASLDELSGLSVRAESRLVLMVGDGWYVALGGDDAVGTSQQIVHRGERVPSDALHAARTDPRGAYLIPH